MANWRPVLVTAGGHPMQFFDEHEEEMFVTAFSRQGWKNDDVMPRRVIGIGATRDSARAAGLRAVSRYDDMPTILLGR